VSAADQPRIVTLHFAVRTPPGFNVFPVGPQWYMTCFPFRLTGGGTAAPRGARFPGAYDLAEPGFHYDLRTKRVIPVSGAGRVQERVGRAARAQRPRRRQPYLPGPGGGPPLILRAWGLGYYCTDVFELGRWNCYEEGKQVQYAILAEVRLDGANYLLSRYRYRIRTPSLEASKVSPLSSICMRLNLTVKVSGWSKSTTLSWRSSCCR